MDENNSGGSPHSATSTFRLANMASPPQSSQVITENSSPGTSGVAYFDIQSEEVVMEDGGGEGEPIPEVVEIIATADEADEEDSSSQPEPGSLGLATSHYNILQGTSQRQKPLLIDTRGYTYNQKKVTQTTTYWRCSVRNKTVNCGAGVVQKKDAYHTGSKPHLHPAQPTNVVKLLLIDKMKAKARIDTNKTPRDIVNEVIEEQMGPCAAMGVSGLPTKQAMTRRVSRLQNNLRPSNPTSLDFKLKTKHLPSGFVRQDIRSRGSRHILIATDIQLHHLMSARRWYVDIILREVTAPFTHLLCFSCFAKKGDDIKLVPIGFVLMSSTKSRDFKAILRCLVELTEDPRLTEVVMDFDQSLWKAFKDVLPGVILKGSLTHWKQSIRWKIQDAGLSEEYSDPNSEEHQVLSKLAALPYLPDHLIIDSFQYLRTQAQGDKLEAVFEYVSDLWIEDDLWTPQTWSVYDQSVVWFNNYAGWRQKIKQATGDTYPFYRLVKLLYTQSQRFSLYVLSVSEKKMKKLQQLKFKGVQYHLGIWWTDYKEHRMSVTQLLGACAQLFADEAVGELEGAAQEKV